MQRFLTVLLALLAVASLALGGPICCVLDVSCCSGGAEARAPEGVDGPRCPCCPEAPTDPERSPAPECRCHEHAPHVSLEEHSPVLGSPLIAWAAPVRLLEPVVALPAAPAVDDAPPGRLPALSLPLLL